MFRALLCFAFLILQHLQAEDLVSPFKEITDLRDSLKDENLLKEKIFNSNNELSIVLALRGPLKYKDSLLIKEAVIKLESPKLKERRIAILILKEFYIHDGAVPLIPLNDLHFSEKAIQNLIEDFDQFKDDEAKKAQFSFMLLETAPGQRPGLNKALDLAKKYPELFIDVISSNLSALASLNDIQAEKIRALATHTNSTKIKILEEALLARETTHAEKWIELALKNHDKKALQVISNLSLTEYLNNLTPKREDLLVELLINANPHFSIVQTNISNDQSILSKENKIKFNRILKKAIPKKPSHVDAKLIYEMAFADAIKKEDIPFIEKMLNDPQKQEQAIHILSAIDTSDEGISSDLKKEIQNRLGSIISKISSDALNNVNISHEEIYKIQESDKKFGTNSSKTWLQKANYFFNHQSEFNDFYADDSAISLAVLDNNNNFFKENWIKRKELNSDEITTLLWYYSNKYINTDLFSKEEQDEINKWYIRELEKSDILTFKKIMSGVTANDYNSFYVFSDWLKSCIQKKDEKSKICEKIYYDIEHPFYLEKEEFSNWSQTFLNKIEEDPRNFKSINSDPHILSHALKSYKEPTESETKSLAALILAPHATTLREFGLLSATDTELENSFRKLAYSKSISLKKEAMRRLELNTKKETIEYQIPIRNLDACKNYCDGSLKLLHGLSKTEEDTSLKQFRETPSVFDNAVMSLKLTTLFKASFICQNTELNSFSSKLVNSLKAIATNKETSADGITPNLTLKLKEILNRKNNEFSRDASFSYENSFTLLLLKDVIEKDPSLELKKLHKELQKKSAQMLEAPSLKSRTGSGVNLFSYTNLLSGWIEDKSESEKKIFNNIDDILAATNNPLVLPYSPIPADLNSAALTESERGSIARALSFHTVLYRNDLRPKEKTLHKETLLLALEKYFNTYFNDLAAHLQREGTHLGKDFIAPYYLYPSLFHSAYAFELLSKDKTLTKEEKLRLSTIKSVAETKIKSLVKDNGDFMLTGGDETQSASGYRGYYGSDQALGLMALSTFANCSESNTSNREKPSKTH